MNYYCELTMMKFLLHYLSRHEYASGYYGVLPFFLSKVFTDVLAIRLIPNIGFAIIVYFMVGKLLLMIVVMGIKEQAQPVLACK